MQWYTYIRFEIETVLTPFNSTFHFKFMQNEKSGLGQIFKQLKGELFFFF